MSDLSSAFEETHYIVRAQPQFTLRVGQSSTELDALLRGCGCTSAVFITAWNPLARALSDEENHKRQKELTDELERRSLVCIDGIGQHPTNGWPGEVSVLALGLQVEAARALCAKYEQLACVTYQLGGVAHLLMV